MQLHGHHTYEYGVSGICHCVQRHRFSSSSSSFHLMTHASRLSTCTWTTHERLGPLYNSFFLWKNDFKCHSCHAPSATHTIREHTEKNATRSFVASAQHQHPMSETLEAPHSTTAKLSTGTCTKVLSPGLTHCKLIDACATVTTITWSHSSIRMWAAHR